MAAAQRMIRVRERMKAIAWRAGVLHCNVCVTSNQLFLLLSRFALTRRGGGYRSSASGVFFAL